jgi:hypothetical protein
MKPADPNAPKTTGFGNFGKQVEALKVDVPKVEAKPAEPTETKPEVVQPKLSNIGAFGKLPEKPEVKLENPEVKIQSEPTPVIKVAPTPQPAAPIPAPQPPQQVLAQPLLTNEDKKLLIEKFKIG